MGAVFDQRQLVAWEAEASRFVAEACPKETKEFMNREGKKGKEYLKKSTQRKTAKRTGELLKGVSKGSAKKSGDTYSVEVKNRAKHAWLVEHGHKLVYFGRETNKRVEGKYPAKYAEKAIRKRFEKDASEFVDRMIGEICR